MIRRIGELTPDATAVWGRMSVEQMVSHLVQASELPFSATCSDRSSFMSRHVIKPLVLYLLPMPKDVRTSRELDQQQDGRKPLGLDVDRGHLIDAVNKLGDLPDDHGCLPHPLFGKMSVRQWAMISHKHIDHHLRQFGV